MNGKIKYEFTAKIWQYPGEGGWHFISFPQELAKEIRDNLKSEEEGWGRLNVISKIGDSKWDTAIWFDSKINTYLLPVKADIRKKEKLEPNKKIKTSIWI